MRTSQNDDGGDEGFGGSIRVYIYPSVQFLSLVAITESEPLYMYAHNHISSVATR